MKLYLDSSAFAKLFVEESGSAVVEDLCFAASELGLSAICVPEIISALNRRVRERNLTGRQYTLAKQQLATYVRDACIIELTPAVIGASVAVLEQSALRAMDALHIACAWMWHASLFVSSDKRQTKAAAKFGLRTRIA